MQFNKIFSGIIFFLFLLCCTTGYGAKITETVPDSTYAGSLGANGINEALKWFESLSRKEKRVRLKEMKRVVNEFKQEKKAGHDVDRNLILQVILGIFIPPLGVYLHEGETNNKFWISILLTVLGLLIFGFAGVLFLGTLPSILYALIVILSN